jgi:hypothetical protein
MVLNYLIQIALIQIALIQIALIQIALIQIALIQMNGFKLPIQFDIRSIQLPFFLLCRPTPI